MSSHPRSSPHGGDTEHHSTQASPASSVLLPAVEIEVSPSHSSRSMSSTSSTTSTSMRRVSQQGRQLFNDQDPIDLEGGYVRGHAPIKVGMGMRTDSFVGESRSRSGSGTGARPGFGPDYHNAIAGQHPPGQDQGRSLRRTESNISITLKKRGYFGQLRRSPSFILFTVFLALFVDMATYGIIVPILPFIVSDKANGGATDTGLLLGVYSIGILMASPLFGVLGDYFVSRRVPMLIGLVVMLISTVLFMVANNFYVFLMARLLQGMAGGSVWTLGLALITDIFPAKTLGVQMGKALIGHTLGLMMGPPLGGILYERGGYRAPFFFVCAITLIDFVCRALIIEEREEIVKALREQGMQHEASEEEAEVVAMRRKERLEGSTSFWTLIKNKRLLGCVIVTACNGFAFSGAEPTVPLHLSSTFHLTSERIGLVFMAFSLPTLTAPISGALSDKFGAKVVCVVSLVLCAGAIIAGGLSQNSLPMIVSLFTIIGTTGIAILAPVLGELSAVVRTTGTGDGSARVYAMFNMAFSIGVLVGPVVCGIVYENFGFMYLSIAMASVLILAVPVALVCLGGLEQKKLDLALAKEEEEKRAATRDSLKRSKYNVEFDGESNEQEYHSDDDEVDSDGKTRVRWSPRATSMEKQLSDGQSDDGDASSQRALVGKGREPSAQILKSARMD